MDLTGQAGLTRDLEAFTHFKAHHGFAITAITLQTSTQVISVRPMPIENFRAQLRFLQRNLKPAIWKIGMIPTTAHVQAISEIRSGTMVLDPIFRASSGGSLISKRGYAAITKLLIPGAIVTPNLFEAETLTGISDPVDAGRRLLEMGAKAVIVKGGHSDATDFVVTKKAVIALKGKFQKTPRRGTGCSFASALAAELARGKSLFDAAKIAKNYVARLLIRN